MERPSLSASLPGGNPQHTVTHRWVGEGTRRQTGQRFPSGPVGGGATGQDLLCLLLPGLRLQRSLSPPYERFRVRLGGSILGGEVALGLRENLRWNKFSSFILATCASFGGRRGGEGRIREEGEQIRIKCDLLSHICRSYPLNIAASLLRRPSLSAARLAVL